MEHKNLFFKFLKIIFSVFAIPALRGLGLTALPVIIPVWLPVL